MMPLLRRWLNPRSSAAQMAVLFVVLTILYYAFINVARLYVPLVPDHVFGKLELWRLITWLYVSDPSPMSVIFGVLILVSIGGSLESYWGGRRLWLFTVGIGVLSGVLTTLLSFVIPGLGGYPFVGGSVVTGSIWVAYGLAVGPRQSNFWGMPATGYTLAAIGAAFALLSGLFYSWLLVVPELIALVLTFVHVQYGMPGTLITRYQSWRLRRDLAKRSSHLRSISGERNTPSGSDKYLH